jgi:diguanylate cyclase (GGDEF)-like protein
MKNCLTSTEAIATFPEEIAALLENLPDAVFLRDDARGLLYGNHTYRQWDTDPFEETERVGYERALAWQAPQTGLSEIWKTHFGPFAVSASRFPLLGSLTLRGGLVRRQREIESEDALHHVLRQAKCLLWQATIEELPRPESLNPATLYFDEPKNTYLHWDIQFVHPKSVEVWLPLERSGDTSFQEAFHTARLPEDHRECDQSAVTAFRSGVTHYEQEFRVRLQSGETRWLSESVSIIKTGEGRWEAVGVCTDATNLKTIERQLSHEALHDPLTGLANRRQLIEALGALSENARSQPALLFLDLDDFKRLNDSFGHHFGDLVLVAFAERLGALAPAGSLPARLGGDEFTLLLPQAPRRPQLQALARQLSIALSEPLILDGQRVALSASIGVARGSARNAAALLRQADTAMHYVKAQGKADCALFYPQMEAETQRRYDRELGLRRAVQQGEIVPHYQPIRSLHSEETVAIEALARWERGPCPPAEFIPLAEELGLIVPLGESILRRACQDVVRWRQRHPALCVNVNVSGRQFHQSNFVERVSAVLSETGLPPKALILELTESILLTDTDGCLSKLQALHSLGVQLCLDDFGTGYSSLSYLSRFPVGSLKIDRSFVHALTNATPQVRQQNEAIVRTIVALAKTLSLSVTAEGIETPEQERQIRRLGADLGQGYLFAHPLSAAVCESYLNAQPRAQTLRKAA